MAILLVGIVGMASAANGHAWATLVLNAGWFAVNFARLWLRAGKDDRP
jgi:hypothetical protein